LKFKEDCLQTRHVSSVTGQLGRSCFPHCHMFKMQVKALQASVLGFHGPKVAQVKP